MPTIFLNGDTYSVLIMPDPFSNLNLILMVIQDDPSKPIETLVLPLGMFRQFLEVLNATR